ncbi:four helix bundle protein [Flavobacteriaceae bacterium]|nr:four helix bundle protein [Flavobacteriaceae bacterium]
MTKILRDFRKYDIWIDSMDLVDAIYGFLEAFPNTEKYGLRSQITRSTVSIPSNIAEGASRNSEKDFARFLEIALGSAFELETHLIIAERRKYISAPYLKESILMLTSLQKRIYALRRKIIN